MRMFFKTQSGQHLGAKNRKLRGHAVYHYPQVKFNCFLAILSAEFVLYSRIVAKNIIYYGAIKPCNIPVGNDMFET
jgi:hypothetical protein